MVQGSSDWFGASQVVFDGLVGFLGGEQAQGLEHGELEEQVEELGRELMRRLFQDHLDLRSSRERQLVIEGVDGVVRCSVERGRRRRLATTFGMVTLSRIAYRQRGCAALHPADTELNLPTELHSHGLRRLAAFEAARGSFDDATALIRNRTGTRMGKRQVEELAICAAEHFDLFYATREREPMQGGDVLVLSVDGKGIVMRPEGLREPTACKARSEKLQGRLSKGEKANRKRMAEVGAVYEVTPSRRTPADVLARRGEEQAPAPTARNKWLTASVAQDAAQVISDVFDEADRRDPTRKRPAVALVDGNRHQINRINAEAAARGRPVTIVIDIVHVLEYLWSAAWCFFDEGDPAAQQWVTKRAGAVLAGNADDVARGIRRFATRRELTNAKRRQADKSANYLENQSPYLNYPTALSQGWPIATGIIEGACRHLVKDRMDITGARWGLHGAEAVLRLRALRSNDDFDEYWRFHIAQELQRIHLDHYADHQLPLAA